MARGHASGHAGDLSVILVVEARLADRLSLAGVLRSQHHTILEIPDGEEALGVLAEILPDLVICHVLLPSMDGYEFVRRMRANPTLAEVPVIFCAARYHEREARELARLAGAFDVVTQPVEADAILETVAAALESTSPPGALFGRASFDRRRWHLLNATLAARIQRIEAEREQFAAVLDVVPEIAAERDPLAMLHRICAAARHIALAQYALVHLVHPDGTTTGAVAASGFDKAGPAAIHPTSSALRVPIRSTSRVYGWLVLWSRLLTEEFSETEKRALIGLAACGGAAYESRLAR